MLSPTVLMLGNFDGVHRGHQKLYGLARAAAADRNLPVTALTFRPHPTEHFRPESNLKLLMTYEEKLECLSKIGVDRVVEIPFNQDLAAVSAQEFYERILKKELRAEVIVVGTDFRFGTGRQGTSQLLQDWCQRDGLQLIVAPELMEGGVAISSSRIRSLLMAHDVKEAGRLLGRPFFYRGEVIHGDKRGRTLGFPTANMRCAEKFPLATGVYVTTTLWRGASYPSVTNIGTRPTFTDVAGAEGSKGEIPIRIETHVLDRTDLELYGAELEVQFHSYLRGEKKFSGIEELVEQIRSDVAEARVRAE
jgi:riboflavin kinase / FMN adenylyltransferase